MVLGKLPVPGRPTIWMTVGQGPTALTVGAGGSGLDIFTLIYSFFPLSPSLWETARYRLKYCLKGPLNPNNQPTKSNSFSHCKVEQKKTVAISQMFSHVQLHVHGMHLLNNRICRYTYSINTTLL